ncbi:MAG: 30S ribosomal protein S16 [bacterium]|nr:30S ribosomal protein S16 [bacterium]
MLKIRMQRTGRINEPSYRIIVVEHTESPKTGNIVERVGTYNPMTKERHINTDRVRHWMSVGAQPSPTVHNMLVSIGVLNKKKINVLPKKSPPKKDEPVAVVPAPTEEKPEPIAEAETPAVEAKEEKTE